MYLSFYDYNILVSSNEAELVEKLKNEFHFFLKDSADPVHTILELSLKNGPEIPPMAASKILENCLIYNLGSRQYIDYFGKALTIWDHQEETIHIYCTEPERLYELAFLSLHSLIGQELGSTGMSRVHALGVSIDRLNALIMLPSKGGKSTLLKHLVENHEIKIIADDIVLIDLSGRPHPFPGKISFDSPPTEGLLKELQWQEFHRQYYPPKWVASLASLSERIDKNTIHNKCLLYAGFRLSQGNPIISAVPMWKMLGPLFEHMILGIGLPQIIEMFLRYKWIDFIRLPYHFILRLISALQLLRRSECYFFYLGTDKSYNAQVLLDHMYERQTR